MGLETNASVLLRGGRVVCPATGTDAEMDVLIENGIIKEVGPGLSIQAGQVVDCSGAVVAPGFVDISAELCDPGKTWREDLITGSEAGAAGGFTTVLSSPRTDPVIDTPAVAKDVLSRAQMVPGSRVALAGALTEGLEGEVLAEVGLMVEAGCQALSDGRRLVLHSDILRRAMQYARPFDVPIIVRPGDGDLEKGTVMHEGQTSVRLGLRGVPAEAEEIGAARLVALARLTGARVHLSHVTTSATVEIVRRAKSDGLSVTAAVPARHLVLGDDAVETSGYHTDTRVCPPLRPAHDQAALRTGLQDGTIDAVTSDHVPWSRVEKELEYGYAKPGAMGLETAFRATLTGLGGDILTTVRAMSTGPASVLGLPSGVEVGLVADLTVVQPGGESVVQGPWRSRGVNEPLEGQTLLGRVIATLVGGRVVYGPIAD